MTDLRKIDALVATNVMGQERIGDCGLGDAECPGRYHPMVRRPCLPLYSTDIAAAWDAFERIGGGYSVCGKWIGFAKSREVHRIDSPSHAEWRCTIDTDEGRYEATAHTAPLAICLAALKAKGIEP